MAPSLTALMYLTSEFRWRVTRSLWLAAMALAGGILTPRASLAEDPAPARIPWHNTRLTGTPDPPLPYRVEKIFTQIAWQLPMYLAPVPGTDDLMIVLQGGDAGRPAKIVRFHNDPDAKHAEPILAMDRRLIYAFAFHPGFASNRFLFVFSNGPWGEGERGNRVSRFTLSSEPPFKCDPASELVILEWKSAGHDGGDLAFGNDGMLYITTGDGSSDSDTWNSGQDVDNLLSTLLRIDIDRPLKDRPYSIPPDNPFVGMADACPEIWAYGFRNPWRMCIDRVSGDIWVGNNGQDQWETAYLVHRGDNFGWSVYEGSHPFYLERKRGPTPIVPPTIEHPHSEFRSLTGGVVYHGRALSDLEGVYVYGDYATGRIWGARHQNGKLTWSSELADTSLQIAGFGVDQQGRLLIVDHGSGIYQLVPAMEDSKEPPFPTLLSETGLFESVAELRPVPGLISYEVNAPGWVDGATAQRFLALPGDSKIGYTSSNGWNFNDGTVLVQTLSFLAEPFRSNGQRRIETRLLVRRQGEWAAYSYRWNNEQTDATLVPRVGEDRAVQLGDGSTRKWRFSSRTECLSCHSRAANYVLGLTELQANRDRSGGALGQNQLQAFDRMGIFTASLPKPPAELSRLADPYDLNQSLDSRARSYLHANCSGCHVAAGGGNSQMELAFTASAESMKLLSARPQHDSFGLPDAMLVAPGRPDHSILLHRISIRGRGQMPPLGTHAVDERAVKLFCDWIAEMKPRRPFVRDWQVDDLSPALDQVPGRRTLESGRDTFRDIGCAQCHRFAGEGGTVGPDLTGIGRRQNLLQVLESIVSPSKIISKEYAVTVLETEDGMVVAGRIEREDESSLVIRTGLLLADTVQVSKSDIRERSLSPVSNMPGGMINVLQKAEVLDLLAYLMSDMNVVPANETK